MHCFLSPFMHRRKTAPTRAFLCQYCIDSSPAVPRFSNRDSYPTIVWKYCITVSILPSLQLASCHFNMTCCWHKLKKWYYGPIISAGRGLMCKPCVSVHLVTHRHQCPQLTTLRHVCVCMHANEMFKEMRGRGWDGGWNEVITWKWDERQHVTYHLKSTT